MISAMYECVKFAKRKHCAASFPSVGKMGMGDLGIGEIGHSPVTD